MRKFVVVLLLLSTPAWAEWTLVGDSDSSDIYADLATMHKRGHMVKMWSLYDLKTARPFADTAYLSSKDQDEYDCERQRTRFLSYSVHSGNMGVSVRSVPSFQGESATPTMVSTKKDTGHHEGREP